MIITIGIHKASVTSKDLFFKQYQGFAYKIQRSDPEIKIDVVYKRFQLSKESVHVLNLLHLVSS